MIGPLMRRWERRLAARDPDRQPHAFDWGLEYLELPAGAPADPKRALLAHATAALTRSSGFYAAPGPPPVVDEGDDRVRFPSAVGAPEPETNWVWARIFPAERPDGRAMIVLPQWNADDASHVGLCQVLARRGITAVRLILPYHAERRPAGEPRADFAVSANLGRTLFAGRQAVADVRRTRAWLAGRGYDRIGLVGTSLGSCISFLALAHEPGFRLAVLHHVSGRFGDVVWRGISTRHVRSALEPHTTLGALRRYWAPISPVHFVGRLGRGTGLLLLSARYDLTFPFDLSRGFHRAFRKHGLAPKVVVAPWGHYTSGVFPFNAITVARVVRYLEERL